MHGRQAPRLGDEKVVDQVEKAWRPCYLKRWFVGAFGPDGTPLILINSPPRRPGTERCISTKVKERNSLSALLSFLALSPYAWLALGGLDRGLATSRPNGKREREERKSTSTLKPKSD